MERIPETKRETTSTTQKPGMEPSKSTTGVEHDQEMQEASGRQDEAQMDTEESELISHLKTKYERGWLMHVIERSDE